MARKYYVCVSGLIRCFQQQQPKQQQQHPEIMGFLSYTLAHRRREAWASGAHLRRVTRRTNGGASHAPIPRSGRRLGKRNSGGARRMPPPDGEGGFLAKTIDGKWMRTTARQRQRDGIDAVQMMALRRPRETRVRALARDRQVSCSVALCTVPCDTRVQVEIALKF